MKVLSVVSQKGGVGKTTLATALAVEASRDGKKTVMFDLDPPVTRTDLPRLARNYLEITPPRKAKPA
jgi:cellulose biosynthesis protein BcsQ